MEFSYIERSVLQNMLASKALGWFACKMKMQCMYVCACVSVRACCMHVWCISEVMAVYGRWEEEGEVRGAVV